MSSSLLRKAVDKAEARDTALKTSLLERVNDCVKELQLKCTSERTNSLNNDEATNSFLWVLEAVFIHGLNNSFLKSSSSGGGGASSSFSSLLSSFTSGATSGGFGRDTSSAVPNPSFWEFVLVFLHRDLIDQINSLHLIHTDVGRCRAWLRISLNEGLLQSFLENMTLKSNRRCLKAFYRSSAFLRDTEKCDILKNYLMGIELLDFRLVINNSFLNHWNSGPLSLVGLWVDENECVQEGVDIAKNLESNKEFQAIPKLQQRQVNAQTPPRFYSELDNVLRRQQPAPLLSEDDALRIILSSSPRPTPQPPIVQSVVVKSSASAPSSNSQKLEPVRSDPLPQNVNLKSSSSKFSEKTEINSKSPIHLSDQLPEVAEEAMIPFVTPNEEKVSQPPASDQPHSVIIPPDSHSAKLSQKNQENEAETRVPTPTPPCTLELPAPTEKVISSSPLHNHLNQMQQLSTSISSIEPESPQDSNERSYTDMLLKYQQRSQTQNESSHSDPPHQNTDDSVSSSSHHNNTNTGTFSDITKAHCGTNNNEDSRSSRKNSTTGSVNTTTTSGVVSAKSSKFTRRKASQLFSEVTTEERIEILRLPHDTKEQVIELQPRISKYTKILASEAGLDSQNYSCKLCSSSIGMIYGPARLCHFTGALYCSSCHQNHEKVIPSRILLNWDFGLYFVCKQAFDFLEDIKDEPVFDIMKINPLLYTEIDECKQVKTLRTKLFYIGMYLKTCKNAKALDDLKKEMGNHSKGHLIDSIHIFTLSDLIGIPNRSLVNLLTKLVGSGSGHILSCTICREKGFICEVCRKPQVIFPFELEQIFKCVECGAVYHNSCMDFSKKCPRCQRWKKYDEVKTVDDGLEMECEDAIDQKA